MGFFATEGWIGEPEEFERILEAAAELARNEEAIGTLGVKPSYAATGYIISAKSNTKPGSTSSPDRVAGFWRISTS